MAKNTMKGSMGKQMAEGGNPFAKGGPKGKPGKAGVKNVDKGKAPPFMKKGARGK